MPSPLTLMMALGKPKSRNPSGETSSSIEEPDQGMEPEMEEETVEEVSEPSTRTRIPLPQGFKAPEGIEPGQVFTTTIRGKQVRGMNGDELEIVSVSDMPMDKESGETMADEMAESPEEQEMEASEGTEQHPYEAKMAMDYKKKKADSMKAKNVFQPGRN